MTFLKRLFRKNQSNINVSDKNQGIVQKKTDTIKQLEVPENILQQITSIEESDIIKQINNKRKENEQKSCDNQDKVEELMHKGKYNDANRLSSLDFLGYLEFYQYAQQEEKNENIKKAAEIYWYNIFNNGTDAPASFDRLLILLRKLKEYEKELIVARVYRNFVNENKYEKIDKRIETIKKKI